MEPAANYECQTTLSCAPQLAGRQLAGRSKPGTAPAPAQALIPNPNQAANAAESSGVDSSSSDEGNSDTSDGSGSEEGSSSEDEAAPSNAGTKAAGPPAQGRAPAVVVSGGGGTG